MRGIIGGLVPLAIVAGIVAFVFSRSKSWARSRGLVEHDEAVTGTHRVSAFTEAIAYLGAILVLAGGGVAIGQRWEDITEWGHVGIFAAGAALFLVVGVIARISREAAFQRLVSVVWFVSAAGIAAMTGFLAGEVYSLSPESTGLIVGLAVTAYAGALWLLRRRALQQLALFGGSITIIVAAFQVSSGREQTIALSLALWGFGVAWASLGSGRYLEPVWVAMPVGTALALIAPSLPIGDHGWMYALAIPTAAAVMAVSVPLRNTILLGFGALTMFGYVTSAVVRYFRESLGVPAALAVTGLLMLVLAAVSARLIRATRPPQPQEPPAEPAGMHIKKAS